MFSHGARLGEAMTLAEPPQIRDRVNQFLELFRDGVDRTEKTLTTQVRFAALDAEWPLHVASALYVEYTDQGFVVGYPEALRQEVEGLEYGDADSKPNAVIRPFQNRIASLARLGVQRNA